MLRFSEPRLLRASTILFVGYFIFGGPIESAKSQSQCVRLEATHPEGVPLHQEARNSFSGKRIQDGSVVEILERSNNGNWVHVRAGQDQGWVSRRYIGVMATCTVGTTHAPTGDSILIGTWNIEWLKDGKKRGFPEFQAGQSIRARTEADFEYLANIIRSLDAKLLMLVEINGFDVEEEDEETEAHTTRSEELDRLIAKLGEEQYDYVIGSSGQAQRLAMLFDKRALLLVGTCEADLPNPRVQGSSLFARQPLLAYFRILKEGAELNDFVAIGLHLASGQDKTTNHDLAMTAVVKWIADNRTAGTCIPEREFDVIIGGDFNANRFDNRLEAFWDSMEQTHWDVLADDASYPATRLSGNPPEQRQSKIDYLIISKGDGGLAGEEVSQTTATVHSELIEAAGGGMQFRTKASDHLPVTVSLRVGEDHD